MSAITLMDVVIPCLGQSGVASATSRYLGSGTAHSRVCRHQESRYFGPAGFPVCGVVPCFYSRHPDHHGIEFSAPVMPQLHRVTIALHARNAKKFFIGRVVYVPVISRFFACNVGRQPVKVPKNPVVSPAVTSPFNCMMLDKIPTTESPDWPTRGRVLACLTSLAQVLELQPTVGERAP